MVRTEDRHLIRQCLLGDADAFGELIKKYIDSMHARAHRRVSNFHDAQDITQEAFLIAYQRLSTLKRWDNFPEWMYSIIKNLCRKWRQSQLRQLDIELLQEINTEILNPPSISLHREIKRHESLHESLATLPEMYSQVLRLSYLGGMKSREIGQFLGISKNTVDTRLRRAKKLLRKEMQQSISCEEREASFKGLPPSRANNPLRGLRLITLFGGEPALVHAPWGALGTGASLTRCPCFFC